MRQPGGHKGKEDSKVAYNPDEGDTLYTCVECGASSVLKTEEKTWYAERQWDLPKRCFDCRAKRRAEREKARTTHPFGM